MFNFNLINKAATDVNISDSQFRTLYIILNNCSLNDTNSIEMYNAFLMDKLHYSESTVKRCTKGLEDNGYINIKRAVKKKQPNVITLVGIENNSRDEATNAVKNDTLYNNINKENIIQSIDIQGNETEDKGIDYNVYVEQQMEKKKAEYNVKTETSSEENNTENNVSSTDDISSSDYSNDCPEPDIDAMYEAYMQVDPNAMIQDTSSSTVKQKSQSIDWNGWRQKFEEAKTKAIRAKDRTSFEAAMKAIVDSLEFAQEHMKSENFRKVGDTYIKWNEASEPYFYYNKQNVNAKKNTTPIKVFSPYDWDDYECRLRYDAEHRLDTAKDMLKYLSDCGKAPQQFFKNLKNIYGIDKQSISTAA